MDIKHVLVVGAGTMGQGIAQWFLTQKVRVELIDHQYEKANEAKEKIFSNFDLLKSKGKLTQEEITIFKDLLHVTTQEQLSKETDLAIEAIFEDLNVKKDLFHKLDKILPEKTIFASNTSSFPITELGASLRASRRKHFLGLHFFNPATLMKLVEIIQGQDTSADIAIKLKEWFKEKGKTPCLCADAPGFIVNRIARNFYGESLRIAQHYDQERFREIDQIVREVGGFKMGPFELMDLIGIDVNLNVTQSVYEAFFHEPRFKPHRLQKEMVTANKLGKKTKQGFYQYE